MALNSLTYNVARFVGPAISGPMIAAWGVVPSIAVNAVAFFYASVTMTLLRLDPAVRMGTRGGGSVLHDALEGLRYVTRHPGIGPLLLFAATVGMTLRAVGEMLPPYVSLLFGRGAEGLATLASTMGCAAMAGGFLVAIRGRINGLARIAVGLRDAAGAGDRGVRRDAHGFRSAWSASRRWARRRRCTGFRARR